MIEYSWEIFSLYTAPHENGLKNVVKKVNWRYQIKDNSYYADIYLVTELTSPTPDSFIVYDDLTDDVVFSWISSVEDMETLQSNLQDKLNDVKRPAIVEQKVPWNFESRYTGKEDYLIVFDDEPNKDEKIWGPMKWNSKRANDGLKARGVEDYKFVGDILMYQKGILPIDSPTVINDRVKLYKVEYTNSPELDGIFEYHEGITWVTDSGKAVGTYFVLTRSVQEVKEILNKKLSEVSFNKLVSGTEITVQNQTIKVDTHLPSRINLLQRWELMSDDQVISCKLNDTAWFDLSKTEVGEVLFAIEDHISEVYSWEKSVFDQIKNSTTIDQLKQIEV
jgi:hypothetical protein